VGGFTGSDTLGFYNMTKAAEQSLARSLAYEWGPKNIRVNCIAPGLIRTDMGSPYGQVLRGLTARPSGG
jgi:NAD(P)-dependent dehydrogenase (short-subunit alcohol dehydrogenase family)